MSFTTSLSIKDLIDSLNKMDARIRVLEGAKPVKTKVTKAKKEPRADQIANHQTEHHEKKRGRKPSKEIALSSILREGEHILARIPLGERRFDEYDIVFTDGNLSVAETGETYDHPTTLVSSLAKILEDCGERSSDCSKSMNGWILCVATRNGKRITLDKLKSRQIQEAEDDQEVEEFEAEEAE